MMRRGTSRHDFDLVLAGDFRGQGEAVETMASHLASLAGRQLEIGLLWIRDPAIPASTPLAPRLARLVREHSAVPIAPDCEAPSCRLALLYTPRLLADPSIALPTLRADHALVVLAEPLQDGRGPLFDPGAAATAIEHRLARRQTWCPAGPAIRRHYLEHGRGVALHEADLPPLEPLAAWRIARRASARQRPILGRMLRPGDDRLPGSRDALLQAHPDAADLAMRFLGGEPALAKLVQPLPKGWEIAAPDAVLPRRFLARLDFYVQQGDEPQRQFTRGALPAMAAGRVVLMHPGYRGLFGAGPAYRDPDQVADSARYLHAEPRFYERYLAEQDAALAERFGPERLLALVGEHVRLPRRTTRRPPPGRRTVAFYPTNGVGLGHVTRLLAIARRLPPHYEPVFLTPCHALAVIEHAGYRTEYVPEAAHDETVPADHHAAMAPRLLELLRYHAPAAIVFDGNVPRDSLLTACGEFDAPMLWVRRGMWRADPQLARHLALSRGFDAVLEPSEVAAAADRGVTASAADAPTAVPPVMLLDRSEILPAAAARAALGLDPDRPAALIQLGAGNNNDIDRVLDHVVTARPRTDLQLVVAEWLIREAPVRRRGIRYLSAFPNARHFRAFDFAISAAGYNSFHELLHYGVPTLFVPNDHQKVDDQRARAEWAEGRGAGICLPRGGEAAIAGYVGALLDGGLRRQLARRARAVCPVNGALAAAQAVVALAERG